MALTKGEMKMIWTLIKCSRTFSESKFDVLSMLVDEIIEKSEEECIKMFLELDLRKAMEGWGEGSP